MLLKKYMVYGIVILAMLFWSATYIWYKVVFEALRPISVMTIRLLFSSMFLLIFSTLIKKLQIPNRKDFGWLLLLSLFQPFLYFLAESYGVSMVSSTVAAVIISTIPVFTPLVAYLFFRQTITIYNFWGILISFIGVIMVLLGKNFIFDGSVLGLMILIGAVLSALGYAAIIVRLTDKYNAFTIISWQNLFGFFYFLPFFFIFDYKHFITAPFNQTIVLNLIYLGFFGSSLAYVLFTYSIKTIGITKSSLFTNTIPLFTALFAYLKFGETLTTYKFLGILVVLFGLYLGQTKRTTLIQNRKKKNLNPS
jgi:drug/metabolite transporter (DMT)-like permease